ILHTESDHYLTRHAASVKTLLTAVARARSRGEPSGGAWGATALNGDQLLRRAARTRPSTAAASAGFEHGAIRSPQPWKYDQVSPERSRAAMTFSSIAGVLGSDTRAQGQRSSGAETSTFQPRARSSSVSRSRCASAVSASLITCVDMVPP